MLLTIIVGETGSGKSYFAKNIFNQTKFCFVYDFQNEYNCAVFNKTNIEKFKLVPNRHTLKDFIGFCKAAKGYNIFCEEATGLFRGSINTEFTQCILSKRHTKNNFYLIFHALHRVPPQLMEFCDTLVLFKTNDLSENIERKYPEIVQHWRLVNKAPRYTKQIINLSNLTK